MKKRYYFVTLLFLSVAGCKQQRESIYQSVYASGRWDEKGRFLTNEDKNRPSLAYVIINGNMYLNTQNVKQGLFYTFVDQPEWDESKIDNLKRSDEVFASHLPDRNDKLGGVRWLKESK